VGEVLSGDWRVMRKRRQTREETLVMCPVKNAALLAKRTSPNSEREKIFSRRPQNGQLPQLPFGMQ
jgi:hypothetical protein